MATTKLYDLAVKVGEYQDRNGNTKGRYENIGAAMRNDNGTFLMLKKTFNPAGVPGDGDSVLVSCFEPKPKTPNRDSQQGYSNASQGGEYNAPSRDLDDAIPF